MCKLGIHLSTNEAAPYCTTPMWFATSTRHYCKCVRVRHVWSEIYLYTTEATETVKAVHTERAPNNAHFDGLTTIESGCAAHEHICSIYLRLVALTTLSHWGDMVPCGFVRAQVYSQLNIAVYSDILMWHSSMCGNIVPNSLAGGRSVFDDWWCFSKF